MSQTELIRYGAGIPYIPTVVGDPGPVPPSFASRRTARSRARRLVLELDEGLDRAWAHLVREVRATGDLEANKALRDFAVALASFHNRPRV